MKILLINTRFAHIGGPERYLFNLKELLENNGHTTIPFSIQYALNEPSDYARYFASPLSDDKSVYYKNQEWNLKSVVKTLERNFYSFEVERKLIKLIDATQPDFAIVLLYLRKLSPAVLVALNRKKIPFFVRLSDFGMICPGNTFFRQNQICELCSGGHILSSVKYKCVHDSYGASLVNYLATKHHQNKGYFDLIKHFVSPTKFLIDKMVSAGWDRNRFFHLPTFANISQVVPEIPRKSQVLYAGRLEHIKGVHVLLKAIKILREDNGIDVSLKLAGDGNDAYISELKDYCIKNGLADVEFLGNLNKSDLFKLYEQSLFSVIPSLWYDNLPNSALESLSAGTPVVASRHGCFPELITQNENGVLFEPGDSLSLATAMKLLLNNPTLLQKMHQASIESVKTHYSPEKHYRAMMSVIENIRSGVMRN